MFKQKIPQKPHQHSSSCSLLSQLVRSTSQVPDNAFIEYYKFNGEVICFTFFHVCQVTVGMKL